MATYLTNDEWAVKKGYADFNTFATTNDYPISATLTAMREEAYALINEYMDGSAVSGHSDYLRNLEYRIVELMIDEEQGRMMEEGRPTFIPRDYIFERDRKILASLGSSGFNRGVHG